MAVPTVRVEPENTLQFLLTVSSPKSCRCGLWRATAAAILRSLWGDEPVTMSVAMSRVRRSAQFLACVVLARHDPSLCSSRRITRSQRRASRSTTLRMVRSRSRCVGAREGCAARRPGVVCGHIGGPVRRRSHLVGRALGGEGSLLPIRNQIVGSLFFSFATLFSSSLHHLHRTALSSGSDDGAEALPRAAKPGRDRGGRGREHHASRRAQRSEARATATHYCFIQLG